MLYVTDPGATALSKLGVFKKVWFRPQVGNFLLFSPVCRLGGIHRRGSFSQTLLQCLWQFGVSHEKNELSFLLSTRIEMSRLLRWRENARPLRVKTRWQQAPLLPLRPKIVNLQIERGDQCQEQAGRKCLSYLKEGGRWKKESLPRWFPSAESALRAEKLRIFRGWRKGGCLVKLDEFKAAFYALDDTLNQVTVDPKALCARNRFTGCVSMKSRIFAQQKNVPENP